MVPPSTLRDIKDADFGFNRGSQTGMKAFFNGLIRSRKFALLGSCIESSMVPSFTGGSLWVRRKKMETHLAQLD
jgi:hypothetical protein